MKKFAFLLACAVFLAAGIFAQTAEQLEGLLDTAEVTYMSATLFVLQGAGIVGESAHADAAFAEARSRSFLPRNIAENTPVTLGGLSFLMMRAFDIKGGMWYRLFPGPRYANRFLVYHKLIQGSTDPSQKVSGEQLLRILGRVLNYTGADA
ncbi:hypothetical protein [Leadbettera azotonutricia]|uniref:Uncharacterized protein n=1 Tax=Leadbettera azotonutricia (strain ATCC BAA-888 / DSM 13862 / ZAS-9) TaxID=545695 RepID=F5Y8K4_LEAAZ|nr:hypothetical protein [Leadbettera azotonutricia]AEF82032.1 hypothetical protein TREAZ_3312 [Leadbettera azotonutricia ZAS-9]